MKNRFTSIFIALLVLLPWLAFGLTAEEYEELGRQSAQAGQYSQAAQHYSRAAEAYAEAGNNTAAAINHERAATFYGSIGAMDEYLDQAARAAESYYLAGEDYLFEQNFWFAANAFARSAAIYNATDDPDRSRELQIKSGNTYVLAADYSSNTTEAILFLYSAALAYHDQDQSKFSSTVDQLNVLVEEAKSDAIGSGNPQIFDVLELYYLPLYTQALGDDIESGTRFEEIGDLATKMKFPDFAGSYYATAAVFYLNGDDEGEANRSLALAADSYQSMVLGEVTWNYTTYLYLKTFIEEALFIGKYLGDETAIKEIEDFSRDKLDELVSTLVQNSDELIAMDRFEEAASNLSGAAEISYVIGREDEFRRLNGRAGYVHQLAGQEAQSGGDEDLALIHYEEAAFLLKIAGNESASNSYSIAADLYGIRGNEALVLGNLTYAATNLFRAARLFTAAGNDQSASGFYGKYISVLQDLMELDPQSRGILLVSVGDAQRALGDEGDARDTYADASDELVTLLSQYMATSADLLLSFPALPTNLVKSYRLSGRHFLARNTVETLNVDFLYPLLANIAPIAQSYQTASRTYYYLAQSDISFLDFPSYSTNLLFSSLTAMLSGNEELARQRLGMFESLDHPLQSSNRKFHQLLTNSLDGIGGNPSSLAAAREILYEIRSITEESDIVFLLEDIGTFLDSGGDSVDLSTRAAGEADKGKWESAGKLFGQSGILRYFAQDYAGSLEAFENSSFYYIKSGKYEDARVSANRAFETVLDPPDFTAGLVSLAEAFVDSNRTLAGIAKASFMESIRKNYRVDESNELVAIAESLQGTRWGIVLGQVLVGIIAVLVVLAVAIVLKRRSDY